jgi:hypothetical protein
LVAICSILGLEGKVLFNIRSVHRISYVLGYSFGNLLIPMEESRTHPCWWDPCGEEARTVRWFLVKDEVGLAVIKNVNLGEVVKLVPVFVLILVTHNVKDFSLNRYSASTTFRIVRV